MEVEIGGPIERRIADLGPGGVRPTLIVVGAVHGNEPAGVEGGRRVVRVLREREDRMLGRAVFLVGNIAALEGGVRYVDRDLNRAWTPQRIEELRCGGEGGYHEDVEQLELLRELDRVLDEAEGHVSVMDVHTTSGSGGPFTAVSDSLTNRAVALKIPVPLVLGLEELVDGTLHDYMGRRGALTMAFESGQHDEPRAIERAEAGIWMMLYATGIVDESDFPEVMEARKLLHRDTRHLPPVFEMRYRHPVEPDDEFQMNPGYRNFQPIRPGEELARDRAGPVRARERARVLMPLYQDQGTDGFFEVREFNPLWLALSRVMRKTGMQRWVHLAPGIRRHPTRPGAYVINRRVARWYALQLMHLLGLRKIRESGDVLVVLERAHPD